MMNESQFNQQLDDLMLAIEDAIEDAELDIDTENAAGILTLTFENDSKVILSRQTPVTQLWLAARSGGFHFDYDDASESWVCDSSGDDFLEVLNRCCSEQAEEEIELVLE
ncbi:iron donor protein CyaY [Endozoicomonadaceae bacterium StTr2]